MELPTQRTYFVVQCSLHFASLDTAKATAPQELAAHISRSKELYTKGTLLLAGAFLEQSNGTLNTMALTASREDAEDYLHGDPFYQNGMMSAWSIREWANMFA